MRKKPAEKYDLNKLVKDIEPAPEGTRKDYWDSKLAGFGVRVTDKGHATFFIYARWPHSKFASRRKIGPVGLFTVSRAREIAKDRLAMVQLGTDPYAEMRRERAETAAKARAAHETMFENVAERWFATIRGQARGREVEADFRREYVKRFEGRAVDSVTKAEVREMIETKAQKHPAQARNLLGYGKRFFAWTVDRDIIAASPVQLLQAKRLIGEKVMRDRVLTDDELRAVWFAAEQMPYPFGPLIRMLILTGQRRSEVGDARWREFDLTKREWIIPRPRMKKRKGHLVPLVKETIDLLDELPHHVDGDCLFSTSAGATPTLAYAHAKTRLDQLTGKFDSPWVFHDIRRTVRTNLGAIEELDKETRERMVAHSQGAMSDTYDLHDYASQKRRGFQLWAERLATILRPPHRVVALRR